MSDGGDGAVDVGSGGGDNVETKEVAGPAERGEGIVGGVRDVGGEPVGGGMEEETGRCRLELLVGGDSLQGNVAGDSGECRRKGWRGAVLGVKEEGVGEATETAKMIDGEGEEKDAFKGECLDNCSTGPCGVRLSFELLQNTIKMGLKQMVGFRGRPGLIGRRALGDRDINGKVGGRVRGHTGEGRGTKRDTDVCRAACGEGREEVGRLVGGVVE